MTSTTMDERSGTERLQAKERRRWLIVAACLLVVAIEVIALWATGDLPQDIVHMPPAIADGMATGILVGAVIGFRFLCKQTDEHDVRARMFGAQVAFTAFMIAAPTWALFAIGGVLPPVSLVALWIGAAVIYLAAFLWRKYR